MSVLAPDSRLLTVRETAERLTVSEKTVRRLIGAGIMPAVRVSAGAIRGERDELEEWLAERRTTETAVGDSAAEAVGRSSVGAGASIPSRPRNPAAHVRVARR